MIRLAEEKDVDDLLRLLVQVICFKYSYQGSNWKGLDISSK